MLFIVVSAKRFQFLGLYSTHYALHAFDPNFRDKLVFDVGYDYCNLRLTHHCIYPSQNQEALNDKERILRVREQG